MIKDIFMNWTKDNPIIEDGEIAFETDTRRFKVGDGVTPYRELNYLTDPSVPMIYRDLLDKNICLISALIIAFIFTAIIWGLLSINSWISNLKFIWQYIGSGIIYFALFLWFNRILSSIYHHE